MKSQIIPNHRYKTLTLKDIELLWAKFVKYSQMTVALSLLEFEGGKCRYHLLISWFVTGAWPGARVAGLHGSAGLWEEAGRHYYEKEAWHTGGPQTTHEGKIPHSTVNAWGDRLCSGGFSFIFNGDFNNFEVKRSLTHLKRIFRIILYSLFYQ